MIQYILTLLGLLAMTYGLREWRHSYFVGLSLIAVSAAGILLVWMPHTADRLAQSVGVHRGADMVLYCYSAVSFLMILNLGLKQRGLQQSITELARHMAINAPQHPVREDSATPAEIREKQSREDNSGDPRG